MATVGSTQKTSFQYWEVKPSIGMFVRKAQECAEGAIKREYEKDGQKCIKWEHRASNISGIITNAYIEDVELNTGKVRRMSLVFDNEIVLQFPVLKNDALTQEAELFSKIVGGVDILDFVDVSIKLKDNTKGNTKAFSGITIFFSQNGVTLKHAENKETIPQWVKKTGIGGDVKWDRSDAHSYLYGKLEEFSSKFSGKVKKDSSMSVSELKQEISKDDIPMI